MAKHKFQKGVSGNPSGRPKLPPDIVEAKKLTKIEFERLLNKFIHMDRKSLAEYAQKPDATAMELLIASIVHKAIIGGDHVRAEFLLNRLIGKVVDEVHNDGSITVKILDYTSEVEKK